MMDPSMKDNTNIRYKKVWRRKKKQEEQVNEDILEIVLTGFVEVWNHNESIEKEEDVKI
jgi:hypothetical protein